VGSQYVDVTPTWLQILGDLTNLIERGTEEGQEFALLELQKMAMQADARNDEMPADRKVRPSPQLMLHMARSIRT
jgi:hypothetical protein